MNTKERIEREVEKTLSSFDRKLLLEARPDFYARLQGRIRSEASPRRQVLVQFLRRRVLVPAVLALMIALNIITASYLFRKPDSAATGREQAMIALAEEYSLTDSAESVYWK